VIAAAWHRISTPPADYGTGNAPLGYWPPEGSPAGSPEGSPEREYYWDRSANSYQKTDAEYVEDLGRAVRR